MYHLVFAYTTTRLIFGDCYVIHDGTFHFQTDE